VSCYTNKRTSRLYGALGGLRVAMPWPEGKAKGSYRPRAHPRGIRLAGNRWPRNKLSDDATIVYCSGPRPKHPRSSNANTHATDRVARMFEAMASARETLPMGRSIERRD
jgi:hypothetical protein